MVKFGFRDRLVTAAAVLILLLLLRLPSAAPDIASDRAALLAFRDSVSGRPLFWNVSSATPCSWAGVYCSPGDDAVVGLHLPAMGLSGSIPPSTISKLTSLQILSLRYNTLSGPLPPDLFDSLASLRGLYLQNNLFSGQIPGSFSSLSSLFHVNLAHNNFSGPLPPSFNNLTRLATLLLEDNNFSGPMPDVNVPFGHFNVSGNNFTGEIPGSLSHQPMSSFSGNSLCGAPLNSCHHVEPPVRPPARPPAKLHKGLSLSSGAIAGIVIASAVGLFLILLLLICLWKCLNKKKPERVPTKNDLETTDSVHRGKKDEGRISSAAPEGNVLRGRKKDLVFFGNAGWDFDLEDLLRASAEVLGKGAFGTVYKAMLETGLAVAVKRLREVPMGEKEFGERMDDIGRLDHENLVPLRGYYYNKEEKLLVYEYLPMGSLSALLHGNRGAGRTSLNWEARASIALGTACGLSHIHSHGPSVSHGSIKSSNILLTNNYEARVSDFGLAHFAGLPAAPNRVPGYQAPEVTDLHRVSQKADVYSFGVLLLELLTGKAPTHEEGFDLPKWVQSVLLEEWTAEVFDVELLRYEDVDEEMVHMLQLGVECTGQHPDKRPSMDEVRGRIEEVCRGRLGNENADFVDVDIEFSPISEDWKN